MALEDILTSLGTYGYLILAFYSFGGGMVALIGAGILSAMGKMDISTSIAIATLFNFVGDSVLFYLAQTNKKEVMGYMKKHKRKIAYTNLLMRKYGWLAVFLQKYIYGVKTLVPIVMGLTKYEFKKFVSLNFFASIIWGLVVGLVSFYFSTAVRGFWN
jgi:membrane protein DedA with SNARE-associated domain